MLICPKCKSEYVSGYKTCADCNIELIETQGTDELMDEKAHQGIHSEFDQSLVFLKNISDNYQKELIVSFLETEDIPVIGKYDGIGQYLKIHSGQSYFGENLYVVEEDYEKAKTLVDSLILEKEIPEEDYILEYNRKMSRRKKALQIIIFLIFIVPLLFGIIIEFTGI